MQPKRRTKSKAHRAIKNTPIADFTQCNKECTYYYNVAQCNTWEKHIWTEFFWKKELQRRANDRLQVQQPFGFYFDEGNIELDLLIRDLQCIISGDTITPESYVDEDDIADIDKNVELEQQHKAKTRDETEVKKTKRRKKD